jgi:hypothetical protein
LKDLVSGTWRQWSCAGPEFSHSLPTAQRIFLNKNRFSYTIHKKKEI